MGDETTDLDAAQAALDEARQRLAEVPAEVVVTNHVMGLYELAAIHLAADPPELVASQLAIDAVRALVETLGDRLGSDVEALRAALSNIQMAYVEVAKGAVDTADAADGDRSDDAGDQGTVNDG